MTTISFKVVILGAGVAGGYAARGLVEGDESLKGQVCLIGEEGFVPYERPALTRGYLLGKLTSDDIATCAYEGERHIKDWYPKNGVQLYLNLKAISIDFKKQEIKMNDDSIIKYTDYIILSTGSASREFGSNILGYNATNLFYMRTLIHGNKMLEKIILEDKKWVVIGGGPLGLEVTSALCAYERDVTLILTSNTIMQPLFSKELGGYYETKFIENGVKIIKSGARVKEFFVNEEGIATHCGWGTEDRVAGDFFFGGIGGILNLELFDDLEKADRKDGGGIKCDEYLQSASYDNVYVAGDICNYPSPMFDNKRLILGNVRNARATAKYAATSIIAKLNNTFKKNNYFDYLPNFYSDFLGYLWEVWGQPGGDFIMIQEAHPDDKSKKTVLGIWVVENKIDAIFLEGGSKDEHRTKAAQYVLAKKSWGKNDKLESVYEFFSDNTICGDMFGAQPWNKPGSTQCILPAACQGINPNDCGCDTM